MAADDEGAMTYSVGDSIEFELAPDGFCSRWTHNGESDRGATGRWQRAVIEQVIDLASGRAEIIAETPNGDRYHFKVSTYPGSDVYPSRGLRLVSSLKSPGKAKLVERTDPVSKSRYWATEK